MLTHLPDRGVITIAGDDRIAFLQGLVSNDIAAVQPGHAVWAALLTPQGKWLADFFVFAHGETLKLDCERGQMAMLIQRLSRYRLRMKVVLSPDTDLQVYVAWDDVPDIDAIIAPDPRLPAFAWRILAAPGLVPSATEDDWDRHRPAAGLPDGSSDMEADKSVLLEAGFDELGGVSWTKGCYMGQELTARTKYRGLLKRRLVPVSIQGPVPAEGTLVLRAGTEVGAMRSGAPGIGMALLRLDAIRGGGLVCGEAILHPAPPGWMQL